jgi:hypothetical protein
MNVLFIFGYVSQINKMTSFLTFFHSFLSANNVHFGAYGMFAVNTAGKGIGGPIVINSLQFTTPMFDALENPGEGSWVQMSSLANVIRFEFENSAWVLKKYIT